MKTRYIDSDIARLYTVPAGAAKKSLLATLFWGDSVKLKKSTADAHIVELARREWDEAAGRYKQVVYECTMSRKVKLRDDPVVLKVRIVDVAQGDGAIVETPSGQLMLIDGGEESHIRNYINQAYSHVLRTKPLGCAAIVVTHGDADHFAGLTRLISGKRSKDSALVTSERVFHNGLVKRDKKVGVKKLLGNTAKVGKETYCVELEEDLRTVSASKMNTPFQNWTAELKKLRTAKGGKPKVQRLEYGDSKAFAFLEKDGIRTEVLGPIVDRVKNKPALKWLHDAGHTINGHSIVLRLTYGNVRFLFGADLNEESEERLLVKAREENQSLTAEFLKVPHHGSADFSPRMLEAVRPVVSVVSSGDESSVKEYIHPRAGLVGALGRYSRATVAKPLVYVTEMVAFFARLNASFKIHNGYRKTSFGIVHVRTDGERVLVATNSGKANQKEAYAFHVDERGDVEFEEKVQPL